MDSNSEHIQMGLNPYVINPSPPGKNGRFFGDNIFKCIFVNEKFCILIQIPLKFISKGPIDNKSALVQVMTWCRVGEKPLPESVVLRLLTHICSTRGRRVNMSKLHWIGYSIQLWFALKISLLEMSGFLYQIHVWWSLHNTIYLLCSNNHWWVANLWHQSKLMNKIICSEV